MRLNNVSKGGRRSDTSAKCNLHVLFGAWRFVVLRKEENQLFFCQILFLIFFSYFCPDIIELSAYETIFSVLDLPLGRLGRNAARCGRCARLRLAALE